jgi:hypothetical protein
MLLPATTSYLKVLPGSNVRYNVTAGTSKMKLPDPNNIWYGFRYYNRFYVKQNRKRRNPVKSACTPLTEKRALPSIELFFLK